MPRAKKTEDTKPAAKKSAAKKAPKTQPITPKTRAKKVAEPAVNIVATEHNETKFPYESFPYRLEHKEGNSKKICWFEHETHATKYIERHKLKKKEYILEYSFIN